MRHEKHDVKIPLFPTLLFKRHTPVRNCIKRGLFQWFYTGSVVIAPSEVTRKNNDDSQSCPSVTSQHGHMKHFYRGEKREDDDPTGFPPPEQFVCP